MNFYHYLIELCLDVFNRKLIKQIEFEEMLVDDCTKKGRTSIFFRRLPLIWSSIEFYTLLYIIDTIFREPSVSLRIKSSREKDYAEYQSNENKSGKHKPVHKSRLRRNPRIVPIHRYQSYQERYKRVDDKWIPMVC